MTNSTHDEARSSSKNDAQDTPGKHSVLAPVHEAFRKFASFWARALGSEWAFIFAALTIIIWGASGPVFGYSDTWQLVINTGTTIVTFLMVFLIQNTQNRDSRAIHLKLDELIRAIRKSRNKLINLEECSEEELNALEEEFRRFREKR